MPSQQQQYAREGNDPRYASSGHQQQQHYSSVGGSLADQMGGLSLQGSSVRGSSRETPKQADIQWSKRRQTFTVTSSRSGNVKEVDSYDVDQNEVVWVRIDGVKYRGNVRV